MNNIENFTKIDYLGTDLKNKIRECTISLGGKGNIFN